MDTFSQFVTESRKTEIEAIISDREKKIKSIQQGPTGSADSAAIQQHQKVISDLKMELANLQ